jgi:hypothetical protein
MREFKIGQSVYYHPRNRVKAEGRYVVMRLLPQANGEVRYRIRSEDTPSRHLASTQPMQANCAEPLARDEPARLVLQR